MVAQPATAQDVADYLVEGYWADMGQTSPAIDTSLSNAIPVDLTGLTAEGRALARAAMDAWETVADIVFVEVAGLARIVFDDAGWGAYATSGAVTSTVNVGLDWLADYGTSFDSYSFQTYVHEIGHVLGLGHAGPYNGSATFDVDAKFQNDSWQMSIMSYFSQDDNPTCGSLYAYCATPMIADILAIQALYGAATTGRTAGDTIWGSGSRLGTYLDQMFRVGGPGLVGEAMTLWDASGIDTLDLSNDRYSQILDLRTGTFSDVCGGLQNLHILDGTLIENVRAGRGDDRVTGNHLDNVMVLNAGSDVASGGLGDDVILGEMGDDRLDGGEGNDRLEGGSGSDWLEGMDGDDVLIGLLGADRLDGGAGRDLASYEDSVAGVTVSLLGDLAAAGDAVGDTFASIEDLMGSLLADVLRGDDDGNQVWGLDGGDALAGAGGGDTLWGGRGADRLTGGLGSDALYGGGGADTFVYVAQDDSAGAAADRIMDFRAGKDVLDLRAVDARPSRLGDQRFAFDAGGSFSEGELRQAVVGGSLVIDLNTDADADAEMTIVLVGLSRPLAPSDLLL